MKFVLNRSLVLAGIAFSVAAASEPAGTREIGNGGDAVICFTIPLIDAIDGNQITAAGMRSIETASTLEYYRAKHTRKRTEFVDEIEKGRYEVVMAKLYALLDDVPGFQSEVKAAGTRIGLVQDGTEAPHGLHDIKDSGRVLGLDPKFCTEIQAVINQIDILNFNPSVWAIFSGAQQALMQFHEEVYFVGLAKGHTDSLYSQNLIFKLLTRTMSESVKRQTLAEYKFGSYATLSEERAEATYQARKNSFAREIYDGLCSLSGLRMRHGEYVALIKIYRSKAAAEFGETVADRLVASSSFIHVLETSESSFQDKARHNCGKLKSRVQP